MHFKFPPPPLWPVKHRSPSRRRPQDCLDCGIDTLAIGHYYTVHDDLWLAVVPEGPHGGMLCLACLQLRLGRPLIDDDFAITPDPMHERILTYLNR
jgi:hypothetical protein